MPCPFGYVAEDEIEADNEEAEENVGTAHIQAKSKGTAKKSGIASKLDPKQVWQEQSQYWELCRGPGTFMGA
jgi:hypothetical protein